MTERSGQRRCLVSENFQVCVLDDPRIRAGVESDSPGAGNRGGGYRCIRSLSSARCELSRRKTHQVGEQAVGYPEIAGGVELLAPRTVTVGAAGPLWVGFCFP